MFYHRIDDELELRLPEEGDAEEGHALVMRNFAYLREWLPWVREDFSLADTREFIRRNQQQYADGQGFSVRVVYRGRAAGNVGYNAFDRSNRRAELGYWLGAEFQGRGLVTRACRVLVGHAFTGLGMNRVEMCCGAGNTRSRAVAVRLGFREEGVLRQAEWLHDHFHDLVVYGMLAAEWPAR